MLNHKSFKKFVESMDVSFSVDEGHPITITAIIGGEPIGFMTLSNDILDNYLVVDDVNIESNLTRLGIGRELYEYALNYAKSKKYLGIASDPANRNKNSDRFWSKLSTRKYENYDIYTSSK